MNTNIKYLKGIGEKRAEALNKLGIFTVGDLLNYFPMRYENWLDPLDVASAPVDEYFALKAAVITIYNPVKTRTGKLISKFDVMTNADVLTVIFYNNKFVHDDLKMGEQYIFYGKIKANEKNEYEMISPKYEKASEGEYIHPIYRQNSLINSKAIRKAVKTALLTYADRIPETLPNYQIMRYKLLGIKQALINIHFPKTQEDLHAAKRRLIYEELLILQLGLLHHGANERDSNAHSIKNDYTEEFLRLLPFTLTDAQKRAIVQCAKDLSFPFPMRRLLQGDVGSGKTAVAAALIFSVVKNGFQAALMAPTEVLARQHYKTFEKFFEGTGIKIVLLTGSLTAKEKRLVKEEISSGNAPVVIGTHAVISDSTVFNNLALVVTDEQHRFGVNQRAALREKGENPHVLVMSATPIPRTLSLIIYGDLDISILDEKPKGRKDIKTVHVNSLYHERIYNYIKKEAAAGRQTYIVYPMVEESEDVETEKRSAEGYYELLSKTVFKNIRCALLHGKMKQSQKDEVMEKFRSGEIDVLICTIVIEVGIDVPNANTIVIENAECFGLSQLHQLRGRVGRGDRESLCVLISDKKGENSTLRFDVLCQTNDGFVIAEEDLKLRGPGDFFGSKQSGLPTLKLASLMTDSRILYTAKQEAEKILGYDPYLENPENRGLKKKISQLFADIS